MKAIICADIHGNHSSWQKILQFLEKDDVLIIAGDLMGDRYPSIDDHHYDPESIVNELTSLPNQYYLVKGNCDLPIRLPAMKSLLKFTLFDKSIVLAHGDHPEMIVPLVCQNYHPDIYISGHTHLFKLEKINSCLVMNPGSPSQPRSEHRTIGMIQMINNSVNISIHDLDTKELLESSQL